MSGRLPTAFLFYGISGVGKTIASIDFGRGLLCQMHTLWGCGKCESCKIFNKITQHILQNNFENISYFGESQSGKNIFLYLKGEHPDFIYVIPDGNMIRIDQVRGIKDFVYNRPVLAKNKLIIIEGVDLMSPQAANAFLKILEEPPEDTFYILTAININNVLPTIKSRVFSIEFAPLAYEDFAKIVGDTDKQTHELCKGSVTLFVKLKGKAYMRDITHKFVEGSYYEAWDAINEVERLEYDDIVLFIDLVENKVLKKIPEDVEKFEKITNALGELKRDLPKGINVSLALAYIKSIIGG